MRKILWYKSFVLLCIIFQLTQSQAQSSFQYQSILREVPAGGFYKIILTPAIVSKCKNELHDIRILDDKSNQVPYILKSDQPEFGENNFIEFPILSNKKEADKQTHVIIQNQLNKTINQLLLVIKNTEAERTVSISGSDDQKQWFVIKEQISLSNLFIQDQDRFVQSLTFPSSTYKFFEIIINGKDLLPVNIVRVGSYAGLSRIGEYVAVPEPGVFQKDSSNKSSYISLDFKDLYQVNKIKLEVAGPKFFRHNMTIREDGSKGNLFTGHYIISSDIVPSYTISAHSKKLQLAIENQDNPPLKIHSVKAWQINTYLLTYLEAAGKYQLVFGDSTADAPRYDLEFFKDSIHNIAAEINTGPIIKSTNIKPVSDNTGSNNMVYLWTIIVVVLALLLALTFRMVKEVSGKEKF